MTTFFMVVCACCTTAAVYTAHKAYRSSRRELALLDSMTDLARRHQDALGIVCSLPIVYPGEVHFIEGQKKAADDETVRTHNIVVHNGMVVKNRFGRYVGGWDFCRTNADPYEAGFVYIDHLLNSHELWALRIPFWHGGLVPEDTEVHIDHANTITRKQLAALKGDRS